MGSIERLIVGGVAPYIGRRMRRVEDERLITGRGRFAGDIKLDGLVHVAFCRSTLPHALVRAIDTSVARSMPGVVAVWTADDLPETADGLSDWGPEDMRSEEHTSELQSRSDFVCRLLLEKKTHAHRRP